MSPPEEGVYYTVFVKLDAGSFIGRLHSEWQCYGEWALKDSAVRASTRLTSLQAVEDALKSYVCQRFLARGAKYVITKHTVATVESTLESPLEQLARTVK